MFSFCEALITYWVGCIHPCYVGRYFFMKNCRPTILLIKKIHEQIHSAEIKHFLIHTRDVHKLAFFSRTWHVTCAFRYDIYTARRGDHKSGWRAPGCVQLMKCYNYQLLIRRHLPCFDLPLKRRRRRRQQQLSRFLNSRCMFYRSYKSILKPRLLSYCAREIGMGSGSLSVGLYTTRPLNGKICPSQYDVLTQIPRASKKPDPVHNNLTITTYFSMIFGRRDCYSITY